MYIVTYKKNQYNQKQGGIKRRLSSSRNKIRKLFHLVGKYHKIRLFIEQDPTQFCRKIKYKITLNKKKKIHLCNYFRPPYHSICHIILYFLCIYAISEPFVNFRNLCLAEVRVNGFKWFERFFCD